ncbi:MAG: hypothetical protein JSU77_10240 [Fidelibacterota bacterium]|nr:MAG: hypothetical protein JSU77_10240 [Candidatus Neomarinimicrobiota bacterium]
MIQSLEKNGWVKKIRSLTLAGLLLVPLSGMLAQELEVQQQQQEKDYYHEGKTQAQADYTGDAAFSWGLKTGVVWGAITWAAVVKYETGLVVYFAAATPPVAGYWLLDKDETAPAHLTSNLTAPQQRDFRLGYKVGIWDIRKKKYNKGTYIGAGIGAAIGMLITLATTQ